MEEFNIDCISIDKKQSILVTGKRATGKTTFVGNLLKCMNSRGIFKTNSMSSDDSYRNSGDKNFYDECEYVDRSFECRDYDKFVESINDCSCAVIDGCFCNYKSVLNKKMCIVTTQLIPNNMKNTFDFIFCFLYYKPVKIFNFLGCDESLEDFMNLYNTYTKNYGCLVYDVKSKKFNFFRPLDKTSKQIKQQK